jgi:ribonuclease P protein component
LSGPLERGLGASRRLRRRQEFQTVYDRGVRAHGKLMTVFLLPHQNGPTRLGIAATKKLGGAVQRNRAKRLIREVFRQHRNPEGWHIVVVPRTSLLAASFEAIQRDYASCLERRQPRDRAR